MARTIAEIKNEITGYFISNETIQNMYNLDTNASFDAQFSKMSIESVIFYVVASAIWTLEMLFDRHKQEVQEYIDELRPHTVKWYANKAKQFQFEYGENFDEDNGEYDNNGLTDEEIENRQTVKYSAVNDVDGTLYIKVAKGEVGKREPLETDEAEALREYFRKVKDAGVNLQVLSIPGNEFSLDIDIYYDPLIFKSNLEKIDGGEKTVHKAIQEFVETLPFNGEYRNSELIRMLHEIEGVEFVDLIQAKIDDQVIKAKVIPGSGYFKISNMDSQLNINPIAYGTV